MWCNQKVLSKINQTLPLIAAIILVSCEFVKDVKSFREEMATERLGTNTMYPNFSQGMKYTIDYKNLRPKRFEIIEFRYDDEFFDKSDFYSSNQHVSRVIGLPYESIEIRKGEVYINDVKLAEPFLKEKYRSNDDCPKLKIAKDCYFVMVDDRNTIFRDSITYVVDKAYDSRKIGVVSKNQMEGVTTLK